MDGLSALIDGLAPGVMAAPQAWKAANKSSAAKSALKPLAKLFKDTNPSPGLVLQACVSLGGEPREAAIALARERGLELWAEQRRASLKTPHARFAASSGARRLAAAFKKKQATILDAVSLEVIETCPLLEYTHDFAFHGEDQMRALMTRPGDVGVLQERSVGDKKWRTLVEAPVDGGTVPQIRGDLAAWIEGEVLPTDDGGSTSTHELVLYDIANKTFMRAPAPGIPLKDAFVAGGRAFATGEEDRSRLFVLEAGRLVELGVKAIRNEVVEFRGQAAVVTSRDEDVSDLRGIDDGALLLAGVQLAWYHRLAFWEQDQRVWTSRGERTGLDGAVTSPVALFDVNRGPTGGAVPTPTGLFVMEQDLGETGGMFAAHYERVC